MTIDLNIEGIVIKIVNCQNVAVKEKITGDDNDGFLSV